MRALRPYQTEAIDAVMREWDSGVRSTMIVLPTGCGKTFTAAEIIRRRRPTGRILWIAHTTELVQQAAETIAAHTGFRVGIEQADSRAQISGLWASDDVIVASRQTLTPARMAARGLSPDYVATVVIDECHHAVAKQYRQIVDHFASARVLGLTATPIRGDETALAHVFESCAHRYEIRRAIREGFLVPIRQLSIECAGIDLRDVKVVNGDLSPAQLAAIMLVEETLHQIAAALVREAVDRPTIVFLPSVDAAIEFARILGSYTTDRIEVVSGESTREQRQTAIGGFRSGHVRFLINCMVLTEGFDAPRASCIAVARPTKSTSLYTQMIGRGLRPSPDTGKADCLVLDFVGQAGRHQLVTPLDVLAGEPLPEDKARDVKEASEAGMSLDEALTLAEERAKEREERRRAAAEREAKVRAEVAYRARAVDPFGRDPYARRFVADSDPHDAPLATGQLLADALRFYGKNPPEKVTVPMANRMINDAKWRFRRSECTQAQARILAKYGLDDRMSKSDASLAIDALAQNSWRTSPSIIAEYGRRA